MHVMRKNKKRRKKWTCILLLVSAFFFVFLYWTQHFFAHRKGFFVPDEPKLTITENTDFQTIFFQTGLAEATVRKLLEKDEFEKVLKVQDAFYSKDRVECRPLFGWFTMSDRVDKKDTAPLVDLEPGDVILSFSTHSIGWSHGHAGLVLDKQSVLECTRLGKDSEIVSAKHWKTYSDYVVLRVKGADEKIKKKVVAYAKDTLCGVEYHLLAGLIGEKALDPKEEQFGLQCAYLVWYAWQHFGYDLDSDGGRLVTAYDILKSERLEVVQVYGMNPHEFY